MWKKWQHERCHDIPVWYEFDRKTLIQKIIQYHKKCCWNDCDYCRMKGTQSIWIVMLELVPIHARLNNWLHNFLPFQFAHDMHIFTFYNASSVESCGIAFTVTELLFAPKNQSVKSTLKLDWSHTWIIFPSTDCVKIWIRR